MAPEDLARFAVDDLGRGAQIDAHRQHRALADANALGHLGARAEVAEGVRVGEGAVLSMGVYLGASTKIIDRETGEVFRGHVPPYSVVVPGTTPSVDGKPGLYCAVIVKRVDAQTRSKTSINDLLRD